MSARQRFIQHLPEYFFEAFGLGLLMFSACGFAALIFSPRSPVVQGHHGEIHARFLMGMAIGITVLFNIFSPWGKRSGAHFNPAVTLTFYRLGKIAPVDAASYVSFQFIGGLAGILLARALIGPVVAEPEVNYVQTLPGIHGLAIAFAAECIISFLLMTVILTVSNKEQIARWTGVFVALMLVAFITFEQPFSGMSMNPARTFSSAVPPGGWSTLWLYFTAPPLGMFLAAELYSRIVGREKVKCAKLHHHNSARCIFDCGYRAAQASDRGQRSEAGV